MFFPTSENYFSSSAEMNAPILGKARSSIFRIPETEKEILIFWNNLWQLTCQREKILQYLLNLGLTRIV